LLRLMTTDIDHELTLDSSFEDLRIDLSFLTPRGSARGDHHLIGLTAGSHYESSPFTILTSYS